MNALLCFIRDHSKNYRGEGLYVSDALTAHDVAALAVTVQAATKAHVAQYTWEVFLQPDDGNAGATGPYGAADEEMRLRFRDSAGNEEDLAFYGPDAACFNADGTVNNVSGPAHDLIAALLANGRSTAGNPWAAYVSGLHITARSPASDLVAAAGWFGQPVAPARWYAEHGMEVTLKP